MDAIRDALVDLVACDDLTRAYIMTGRVPSNYTDRCRAAFDAARAALAQPAASGEAPSSPNVPEWLVRDLGAEHLGAVRAYGDACATYGAMLAAHPPVAPEPLRAALEWIEGATSSTPGLTDQGLGRAMAAIGERARTALGAHQRSPDHLGNLLARIHGDGGHYVAEHGLDKAVADADALVAAWRAGLIAPEPVAALTDAWRPIETAPKSTHAGGNARIEAVYFLAYCPEPDAVDLESCVCVCWWEPLMKKGKGCWYGEGMYPLHPTHWMPLPAPPLESELRSPQPNTGETK